MDFGSPKVNWWYHLELKKPSTLKFMIKLKVCPVALVQKMNTNPNADGISNVLPQVTQSHRGHFSPCISVVLWDSPAVPGAADLSPRSLWGKSHCLWWPKESKNTHRPCPALNTSGNIGKIYMNITPVLVSSDCHGVVSLEEKRVKSGGPLC